MKEEIKLVDGRFVKVITGGGEAPKEAALEEVKPKEVKVEQKEYSEEVIALRDRVIRGNQKLFDAWMKIRELIHGGEEWNIQMDRWHEATVKLDALCTELKTKGYLDCLYIVDGVKGKNCLSNPDGFWCQVCSSSFRYWEKELMDLPRQVRKGKEGEEK